MDEPDRVSRSVHRGVVALAVALSSFGCASTGKDAQRAAEPLPPQAIVPQAASPTAAQAPADELAGAQARQRADREDEEPTLIVIDPAEPEELRRPSLAEAAAQERARRRSETQPVLVVTNQNLSQHAAGGVLTIAHSTPEQEKAIDEAAQDAELRESYWRERGLEIRKRWREAADRVPQLEEKVAELRSRFYATDDPALRDGQIKPQWDRALADLDQARYQVAQGAEEVADFLEEGRRAGALPGWLREGVELEPEPVVDERDGIVEHEVQEPDIYEPPPGS